MVNEQCIYKIIYITFNDVQTLAGRKMDSAVDREIVAG